MKAKICFVYACLFLSVSFCTDYEFRGTHFYGDYQECNPTRIEDRETLKMIMLQAVEESGATILQSSSHDFPGAGLTMTFVLSESHASIHTYPEHRGCFVDLFTCGTSCSYERFDAILREYLEPEQFDLTVSTRPKMVEKISSNKIDPL